MSAVNLAFKRWRDAEQDVHDAQALLENIIYEKGDPSQQAAQLACVTVLRRDASALQREYLRLVELEAAQTLAPRRTLH